jgi:hypothetical protein
VVGASAFDNAPVPVGGFVADHSTLFRSEEKPGPGHGLVGIEKQPKHPGAARLDVDRPNLGLLVVVLRVWKCRRHQQSAETVALALLRETEADARPADIVGTIRR